MRNGYCLLVGLKRSYNVEVLGISGKIILKWILKNKV
jgi:hypothetical protein